MHNIIFSLVSEKINGSYPHIMMEPDSGTMLSLYLSEVVITTEAKLNVMDYGGDIMNIIT